MSLRSLTIILSASCGLFSVAALGQTSGSASGQTIEQSATYVSPVDTALTIRRVAVLPVSDNTDGIYARPVEDQLSDLVKRSHRWDYVESTISSALPSVADLEEKPELVQKAVAKTEADAFFIAMVNRGPTGMNVRLDLFLKKDGRLVAQEVLKDNPRTEIPQLREEMKLMYARLVSKLPYQGLVLSRENNRVTINLGKSDGVRKDQIVSAVQIISVKRHPRFGFIISSDKEILGKIKILKVEETLAFGAITSERERGAIQKFAKITSLAPVEYGDPIVDNDLAARPDANVAFGDKPKEWIPERPPAFGAVGLRVGFGSYNSSLSLAGQSCCEASTSFYPSLLLNGELWINPQWTAQAEIVQGVISTSNPRGDSTPSKLNHAYSRYQLSLGYNFLLKDDFFGPKIVVSAGLATASTRVDDTSPRTLTSTSFSGALLGVTGSFPINDEKIWYLGGKFNLFLLPSMSESPVTSGGSPKATINDFSLFAQRKLSQNVMAVGSLDFSLYSASYSGAGNRVDPTTGNAEIATSLSQRHTVLSGGIQYMF